MKSVLLSAGLAACVLLVGCQPDAGAFDPPVSAEGEDLSVETAEPIAEPIKEATRINLGALPDFFDCVREEGGLLIASHRAGPAPGYPENAIETLDYATDQGLLIHEIDVVESRDGVLFLLHDRTLGRTTTGDGAVADTDWETIRTLNLKDNDGQITDFTPPKLSDVLLWAKTRGVIVELDKKPTTSFRNIISHVRAADAEDHVVLITYNDNQAIEVAGLAPDLMMTAGVNSRDHQEELEAAGVDFDNVVAWMGTRNPNPRAFAAVGSRGVETAFGTLGRPGDRLDDTYWADGDPSEFQDLVDGGLTLLATDAPYRTAAALSADDDVAEVCGQS
ncbi:MAG: glycerophosphodiester phosphodiesterase family protein [Pseudomonadota bacterium]